MGERKKGSSLLKSETKYLFRGNFFAEECPKQNHRWAVYSTTPRNRKGAYRNHLEICLSSFLENRK